MYILIIILFILHLVIIHYFQATVHSMPSANDIYYTFFSRLNKNLLQIGRKPCEIDTFTIIPDVHLEILLNTNLHS